MHGVGLHGVCTQPPKAICLRHPSLMHSQAGHSVHHCHRGTVHESQQHSQSCQPAKPTGPPAATRLYEQKPGAFPKQQSTRPAGAKIRHRQVPLVLSCLHFLCRPPPCKHNITPLKSYGSAAAQLHRVERKPLSTPHKPCSTSIGAFAKLSSLSTSVNFSQDFTTPTSTQRRFVSFSSSHSTFVGKRVVQHPMHSSQVSKPMSAKQHLRSAQLVP
jgi:hypothetical protein